jgi:hypothetical protein
MRKEALLVLVSSATALSSMALVPGRSGAG